MRKLVLIMFSLIVGLGLLAGGCTVVQTTLTGATMGAVAGAAGGPAALPGAVVGGAIGFLAGISNGEGKSQKTEK